MPDYPRVRLGPLQDGAARILETQAIEGNPDTLARELFLELHDVCLRFGLDGVLDQLGLTDDPSAAEHTEFRSALATKLGTKSDFDPRGPRNIKPKQLADCVVAALGLTITDPPARPISQDNRAAVVAALMSVVEAGLAVPKLRDDIVAHARPRCEERHLGSFDKLAAQLDDRGGRIIKQPKVPLDAVQAIQPLLVEARRVVIGAVVGRAIDRAKELLSPAAAERLDQPITHRLTPRQISISRAVDSRVSKLPATVVHVVMEALTEMLEIEWRTLEKAARAYSASQTFAVGDAIEHPKFGRGMVTAVGIQKIDVEFPDNKLTLIHARK